MNEFNNRKTGVLEYNLYDILDYVLSYEQPNEEIDLPTELNPLLDDMLVNLANAKVVFKGVLETANIEYIPQLSFISTGFPGLGAIVTLQVLNLGNIFFSVLKRSDEEWYGVYAPLELDNLKGRSPIKLIEDIKELIKSKRK